MTYITDGPIRIDITNFSVETDNTIDLLGHTSKLKERISGSFEVLAATCGDTHIGRDTNLTIVYEKGPIDEAESCIIHECKITSHVLLPDELGTTHAFVAQRMEPYLL